MEKPKEYRIVKREHADPKSKNVFIVQQSSTYGWETIYTSSSLVEAKFYLVRYQRIGGQYRETVVE
jgi:hypothetical protein